MKHYAPFVIFVLIILSSVLTSIDSYRTTKHRIIADLNRALEQTLAEQQKDWIPADTIKACRQLQVAQHDPVLVTIGSTELRKHINMKGVKDNAIMQFHLLNSSTSAISNDNNLLHSDTIIWRTGEAGISLAFRAQTPYSFASIFSMSDQRTPLVLWIIALLWMTGTLYFKRRTHKKQSISLGGLSYSPVDESFRDSKGMEIHLTPMQYQLMQLFFHSPSFQIKKEDICEALWPGKEDANETLYTLIKRIRPVIEQHSKLQIETDRGRSYKLITK